MARLSTSILLIVLLSAAAFGQSATSSLRPGKANVQSASQITFGPEGILFVGDSRQAAVFAIATDDTRAPAGPVNINVEAVNEKIAALLGIPADQLLINDMEVNPISRNIYVAVSRGRGPDALPVILKVDAASRISEFRLDNVRFAVAALVDAPEARPDGPTRGPEGQVNQNPRVRTIHDMSYLNGNVLVAGLSNQDFASDMRSIPFPFSNVEKGTGIRMWHAAHGRYETASPVRSFVPYSVGTSQYVLASYGCTPVVKIPVSELQPGGKVQGTTIVELGNGSTPLDMLAYQKGGQNFILIATTSRGVMKFSADEVGTAKTLGPPTNACQQSNEQTSPRPGAMPACTIDVGGIPYQTIETLKGVWQMAKLDENQAVVLADRKPWTPNANDTARVSPPVVPGNASWFTLDPNTSIDLKTIALP
jgi:hypothetical protein